MKKLIIAIAMVWTAVFTQAATVDWSVDGIQTSGDWDEGVGTFADGYRVYLFNEAGSYSRSAMISLIADAANGASDWKTALDSNAASYVGNTQGGGKGSFTTDNVDFKGYMVILDADSIDNAEYAFVTGFYTAKDNSIHKIMLDTFDDDTAWVNALGYDTKANGWTSVAPEPTSGLLILLGMAGLALRRKQK